MDIIKADTQWFLSPEGQKTFENCKNLEERAIFIYSYLKTFAAESLEKDSFLFRMAVLLADEIHSAKTPYSAYPALLDRTQNPFVAYVKNAKKVYDAQANYCILLSILHGIADPLNNKEWIYDQSLFSGKGYLQKLEQLGCTFFESDEHAIIAGDAYNIDGLLHPIQIEIAWLFFLSKKEGA